MGNKKLLMLDFLPDSIFLTGLVLVAAVLILLSLDWLVYRIATLPRTGKTKTVKNKTAE